MPHIINILGILLVLISCKEISNNVQEDFIEMNNKLLDSIAIYEVQNKSLFDEINSSKIANRQSENTALIYYSIVEHNKLIDSTINLILTNCDYLENKVTPSKYLINEGFGEAIKKSTEQLKDKLFNELTNFEIEESTLMAISPNRENSEIGEVDWPKIQFYQVPVFACIPILNKWKLENNQLNYKLLEQMKIEVANK